MEGTKPRTVSSLGMFDLLKGVGMLLIVFAHTSELYPVGDISTITPVTFFLFAYRESLMAAFYIASGYGFRKRSIHKCIEQQLKTLLKPYVYTALATTVLHAFIHHAAFGSWDAAISESAKVLGGFLLGLPHTATYFGQQFFSCGPMWYLVALMLAWVLLAVVLGLSLGKQKDIGVLLTMAVCCMVAMIAISYLEPVLDFLRELETLGDLQGDMLGILLKAVGIGLVSEIAGLVCTDAGNGSLGKALQMLGSAVILYLSLPIFTAMLELIREILREL